jgi:hypothetical protein
MELASARIAIAEMVAKSLVRSLAPAELPLYDAMSQAFFEAPDRAEPKRDDKEETLGFGLGETVLLTPVVLAAASHVATLVLDELGKSMGTLTAKYIAEQVRKLVSREPAALHFSDAQLARIRRGVLETTRHFRMPGEKAALLADALVGHLTATRPAHETKPE